MHHDGDLLLVHRRLAIIDLSETGSQPLWNEDHTVCVIVNGEIYNHAELRHHLIKRGHRFRGRSDSEVIVHLYEDEGISGCCSAVEGMFAFALWDARSRDLYVVRDRLGIKPLVIAEHDQGVTFASTVPALIADPAVPRDLRAEALVAVLEWGFVPPSWSTFRAVRHVAPGMWLRIHGGSIVDEQRWWVDLPPTHNTTDIDVRQAVEQAVISHLVADVPIGVLLSAGIDSGLVTALASDKMPESPIEAWTVTHDGFVDDEGPGAVAAAAHLRVPLHVIPVGACGLTESAFDDVIKGMDEPLAVSSLVGLHALFRSIAPARRVVLTGDGGDELFAGYDWHRGMPAVPWWAQSSLFRRSTGGLSRLANVHGRVGAVGRLATQMRRHPASIYLDKLRVTSDADLAAADIDPLADDPLIDIAQEAWDRFAAAGVLEQMLAVDRATALNTEMLAKVDTASMAYSVEARVPFLADDVVAAAKALPSNRKRIGETGKLCLREWYADVGPRALAMRRKTGFNSPVEEWMNGESGAFLRERAREGLRLFGSAASDIPMGTPRMAFALAVVASWVAEQRSRAGGT